MENTQTRRRPYQLIPSHQVLPVVTRLLDLGIWLQVCPKAPGMVEVSVRPEKTQNLLDAIQEAR